MTAVECCHDWLWKHVGWIVSAVIHLTPSSLCFSEIHWATRIEVTRRRGRNKGWRLRHWPGAWPGKEEACGVPGSCCLPVWAQAQDPELQTCSCLISALKNAHKTWDVYVPISVWHPAILWKMWMQWKQILASVKLEAAIMGHLCPLNCIYFCIGCFIFHGKVFLKYFFSDVTSALVYLIKHTHIKLEYPKASKW